MPRTPFRAMMAIQEFRVRDLVGDHEVLHLVRVHRLVPCRTIRIQTM